MVSQKAQSNSAPPLIEQINNGNWLPQKEAEALRDELVYHAYMTMQPALNTIGMRDGSEDTFGAGYYVLPIWKDRMDSRTWIPTPNADVIYAMSYLDLKKDGPLDILWQPPSGDSRPDSTGRQGRPDRLGDAPSRCERPVPHRQFGDDLRAKHCGPQAVGPVVLESPPRVLGFLEVG